MQTAARYSSTYSLLPRMATDVRRFLAAKVSRNFQDFPERFRRMRIVSDRYVVGPPGLEPGTKGFAYSGDFPPGRTISSPAAWAVGVRDARACHQGHCSPQVVSAPSGGVPPAWLRVTMVCTEGFPEFIPSTARVTARRHRFDESPALTAVLQARRKTNCTMARVLAGGSPHASALPARGLRASSASGSGRADPYGPPRSCHARTRPGPA